MENNEQYVKGLTPAVKVKTPAGPLAVTECADPDYPGIYVTLECGGYEHTVAVIEYDAVKKELQIVNYANLAQDEPTSIEVIRNKDTQ